MLPPTPGQPDAGRERAQALALEAVKLAPDLVPAAALAGRLLGAAGEKRKATRIIEAAWRANPHPDLADAFAHLQPGNSARERLARVESLAGKATGDAEAAIAVARAALDAKEFSVARAALVPLLEMPTRRVAALMAALELQEGDEGRGREWMARTLNARRDPAWTADGHVSDHWLPVSPVTGRLDAFEWRDPLAGVDHTGATIDAEQRALLDAPRAPPAPPLAAPVSDSTDAVAPAAGQARGLCARAGREQIRRRLPGIGSTRGLHVGIGQRRRRSRRADARSRRRRAVTPMSRVRRR